MYKEERTISLITKSGLAVFDLEETLIHTKKEHKTRTTHEVQRREGLKKLTDEEALLLQRLFGDDEHFRQLTGFSGSSYEWFDLFHKYEDPESHIKSSNPYPGVQEFLDWLRGQGKKLHILTNTTYERARRVMSLLDADDIPLFALGGPPKFPSKPDPMGLAQVMLERGVGRLETVVIGDSRGDAGMARRLLVNYIYFQEDGEECLESKRTASATFSCYKRLLATVRNGNRGPSPA